MEEEEEEEREKMPDGLMGGRKVFEVAVRSEGQSDGDFFCCSKINKRSLKLPFILLLIICFSVLITNSLATANTLTASEPAGKPVISIKVGALLEESDHEQANMFIRIIKMINERRDETIRQLFNMSSGSGSGSSNSNNDQNQQKPHHQQSEAKRRRRSSSANSANSQQGLEAGVSSSGAELELGDDEQLSSLVDKQVELRAPLKRELDQEEQSSVVASSASASTSTSDLPTEEFENDGNEEPVVVKLEPMIEFLNNRHSSFEADLKVCQLIESGVHSLIGPTEGVSIQHVQSICDNMELPYFELRPFLGSWSAQSATSTLPTLPFQAQFGADSASNHGGRRINKPPPPPLPTTTTTIKNHSLPQPNYQQVNNNGRKDLLLFSPEDDGNGVDSIEPHGAKVKGSLRLERDLDTDPASVSLEQAQNGANNLEAQTFASPGQLFNVAGSASAYAAATSYDDNENAAGEDNDNNNNNNKTNTINADLNSRFLSKETLDQFPASAAAAGVNPSRQQQQQQQQEQLLLPTTTSYNKLEDLTLNLYPPAYLLTSAYIDLIYAWNWTSFAIVYEEGNSMIKLQDLFKESSGTWTSKWQIKLFQFKPQQKQQPDQEQQQEKMTPTIFHGGAEELQDNSNWAPSSGDHVNNNSALVFSTYNFQTKSSNKSINDHQQKLSPIDNNNQYSRRSTKKKKPTFRDIFWQIKSSGEQNILLDVKTENLYEALKHAQQVGCMTERYSYLITSLDLHTIDLEDFKYSRTRFTALNILQVAKLQPQALIYNNDPAKQATNESVINHQQTNDGQQASTVGHQQRLFDEKYLEKLGIHVIPQNGEQIEPKNLNHLKSYPLKGSHATNHHLYSGHQQYQGKSKPLGYKLSPSVVLEKTGPYMEPASDAYKDWSKREMLLSSPASMGLLPHLDRDNEQRLFEFFVDQQERNFTRVRLSTSSAILHDSLLLFMLGLKELDPKGEFLQTFNGQQQQKLACSLNSSPWLHGSSLVNYMRQISFTGLTGKISFDQRGFRSDFKLDVMGMAPDIGLIKVGEWHSKNAMSSSSSAKAPSTVDGIDQEATEGQGANGHHSREVVRNSKSYDDLSKFYDSELKRYNGMLARGLKVQVPYTKTVPQRSNGALQVNEIIFERLYREQADQVETLIVTTKLSQPYFMLKETPNKLEGNDQYEGFAVDLIHELSKLVNFKYRWREVADKKYGSKEALPNGTVVWNGMIGEIVRGQADLAIVDLTITAQREEAVDFTLPFMNTGISILFKKPTTKVTTLFSFLSPFSSDVWAYVLAAYCGISANLFFVGHLSPYEWADRNPCRHSNDDDNETVLKNQFSLLNSFWFTIGSLMQQGSDLTPRSMSTRTIAGIWYFFTLIMISSYTANLAAFLTVEKVVYPIENVRDLSNQDEIKYGCVESGSTCTFFHDSQIETYKKINETIRKFKTYVRSNDEGQKRVEEGKFAFFMESASIEYIVERNCNLTQIGGLLDSKGYGLATSKRSRLKRPYRTLLSEGILHLQETGMLHILKNRWWKERRGGGTCTDDGKGSGVTELSLANVGGVFVVLLGGLGISFLVAIAEFMWRARRSGSTRDGMCEEMMSDLKFALACKSSTKPINNHKSSSGHHQQQQSQISRRLSYATKQQSSIMSSSSQLMLDPMNLKYQLLSANPALLDQIIEAGGKDCDPVLLHAMLTMVLQQQQQQEQETSEFLPHQHHSRPQRSQTLNNYYSNDHPLQRNNKSLNNQAPESRMSDIVRGFNHELSLDANQMYTNSDSRMRRQQILYQRDQTISNSDTACKRRLLFANQQTIDDSLCGQAP